MQWPIPPWPTKALASGEVGVSASGANTKGAWVTLLSSLPAAASWLNIANIQITTAGDRAALMDIAIGGAGSETIAVADMIFGYRDHQGTLFPLHIPAGATVRARISTPLGFMLIDALIATAYMGEPDSGLSTPGRITTYGAIPASSAGTNITPSGTQDVKGSWTQLTAATTAPIHALMVLAQSSTSAPAYVRYLIDIGVGGAGSETVVLPDHRVVTENSPVYVYPNSPSFAPLSMCIPAGVRLSARCSAVQGTSTQAIEVAVYGFTY